MNIKLPQTFALIAVIPFALAFVVFVGLPILGVQNVPRLVHSLVFAFLIVGWVSSVIGIIVSSVYYYKSKDEIDNGVLLSLFTCIMTAIVMTAFGITSIGV